MTKRTSLTNARAVRLYNKKRTQFFMAGVRDVFPETPCAYDKCGAPMMPGEEIHADHGIPKVLLNKLRATGDDDLAKKDAQRIWAVLRSGHNVTAMHADCNLRKGTTHSFGWRRDADELFASMPPELKSEFARWWENEAWLARKLELDLDFG